MLEKKVNGAQVSNTVFSHLNRELGNVNEWRKANKLSLNIKKSNFVIFRPRQKNMAFIPIGLQFLTP